MSRTPFRSQVPLRQAPILLAIVPLPFEGRGSGLGCLDTGRNARGAFFVSFRAKPRDPGSFSTPADAPKSRINRGV